MSWIGDLPEMNGDPFEYKGEGICPMCSEEMEEWLCDNPLANITYWEYVCECGYSVKEEVKEEELV